MTTAQSLSPQEEQKVELATLAELTGFPVGLIKKELLLENEQLSMEDLRKVMMVYLNNTLSQLES